MRDLALFNERAAEGFLGLLRSRYPSKSWRVVVPDESGDCIPVEEFCRRLRERPELNHPD